MTIMTVNTLVKRKKNSNKALSYDNFILQQLTSSDRLKKGTLIQVPQSHTVLRATVVNALSGYALIG